MADQVQVHVHMNPMRVFEWHKPRLPQLDPDPTAQRMLDFFCTPGVSSQFSALKARYRTISAKDKQLFLAFQEDELLENLFRPLWHAKASFVAGNFLGTIALCGLVAEKVAILTHALVTEDEAERRQFEEEDQSKRVEWLKKNKSLTPQTAMDFGQIRSGRKGYLHRWTKSTSRLEKDAVQAYAAAIRLVRHCSGLTFRNGTLVMAPAMAKYLSARGALRGKAK